MKPFIPAPFDWSGRRKAACCQNEWVLIKMGVRGRWKAGKVDVPIGCKMALPSLGWTGRCAGRVLYEATDLHSLHARILNAVY